jgi:hypothetical protein
MANTELIDQLVSKEALEEMGKLDAQLINSFNEMEKLLKKTQELNVELSKAGKTYAQLAPLIERQTEIEQKHEQTIKDINKTTEQRKDLTERVIVSEREETKEIEKQDQATKKLKQSNEQLLQAAERTAKGIDISAYIKTNEDGMKNYSAAINVTNQQLGIIQGLQDELNKRFREGSITEEQYLNAMNGLTQKQSEYEQSLTSMQQKYENVREAQREVFNPASEAFNALSPQMQEQVKRLVELNVELNNVRAAQKELDKQYKDEEITLDTYMQKKAQLNTLEKDQQAAVKALSTELQLNTQIANSQAGSYENLSAQYSLLKIQINALGEAEGRDAQQKRELEAEAKKLYEQMNNLQKATGKAQLQVGDYTLINRELQQSISVINPMMGTMVGNIKNLGKSFITFLATPIGVVVAAFAALLGAAKLFWDVQKSNINTGREFDAMMQSINSSLDYAKTAFANLDFTNFHEGIAKAAKLGREAAVILGELFELNNSFSITSLPIRAEIAELKIDMRDQNKTNEERLKIIDDIIIKTEDLANIEKDIVRQELEGNKKLLEAQSQLTDEQKKYIIDDYIANKDKINAAQDMIKLEERLSALQMNTSKNRKKNDSMINEVKEAIKLIKESGNYSEEAREIWEKYSMAAEKDVSGYTKAMTKLLNIDIQTTQSLKLVRIQQNRLLKAEDKKEEKEQKNRERELKKQGKEIQKDLQTEGQLEAFRYKKKAETNEAIYRDETQTYDKRRAALRDYLDNEMAALETQADKEIEAVKLAAEQMKKEREKEGEKLSDEELKQLEKQKQNKITLIQEKADYERLKLGLQYNKARKELNEDEIKDYLSSQKRALDERSLQLQEAMNDELLIEQERYIEFMKLNAENKEEREQTEKDYQTARLEIIRKYNQKAFEEQVAALQSSLDVAELDKETREKIEKEITKLKRKNAKEVADYEVDITKAKIEEITTAEEEFNKFMSDKRTQATMEIWNQMLSIANQYYDQQIQAIDDLEARENEYYENRLKTIEENVEAGLLSEEEAAARKRIIEAEQMQKEKQYNEQRKAIQKKQAVWQKAEAVVQATINTATAVTAALPNVFLAAVIGALGAAQIGMILAQKIPEYKRGTEGHRGGLAYVGDGGRSEMIILPSGEIWKTPDKKTLLDLPKGTEVLPDFKQAFENISAQPIMLNRESEDKSKTLIIYDDVQRKLMKNNNDQLSAIHQSLGAIRANTTYSNNRKFIESWIKNY